ncbi:MAG: hypothetical protein CME06_05620 [Gemmatimonadetes bacterium]|nr:hypothetical protein [Gemmatimonadota bacterium]
MYGISLASSFIIGAMVIIQIAAMNATVTDQLYRSGTERTAIEVAASLSQLLESDLRKMGLGLEDPRTSIVAADSTSLVFWADVDLDDTPEQVSYWLSSPDSAATTANPDDRLFYRTVDGEPLADPALGVVDVEFLFFDGTGAQTTDWGTVRSIRYTIAVEPPEPMDEFDPVSAVTSGSVFPKNLVL